MEPLERFVEKSGGFLIQNTVRISHFSPTGLSDHIMNDASVCHMILYGILGAEVF